MMRRQLVRWSPAFILLTVACTQNPSPKTPDRSVPLQVSPSVRAAQLALEETRYEEAERLLSPLLELKDPTAKWLHARLLLETGRYESVLDVTAASVAQPEKHPEQLLFRVRALRALGQDEEALDLAQAQFNSVRAPLRLEQQLLSGELLIDRGQRLEAEKPLLAIIDAYNRSELDRLPAEERAAALAVVGRAAFLLRAPEDANDAFEQAEAQGAASVRTLLWRGELFLEKYDLAQAEAVVREALEKAPQHAEALALLAQVRLAQSFAFEEAKKLAEQALQQNSRALSAREILTQVALYQLEFEEAEQQIQLGLQTNPHHLGLLSLRAAQRFLLEDEAGWESIIEQVHSRAPGYAKIFEVLAEFAEWEHRYEEREQLLRRGVRLDREDGRLRAHLGLTLVRAGSDAAGLVELRQAFELDPYNVRVLNTLDLYEKKIPEHYDEIRRGAFVYRFPKVERELLERYVPPLLEEAHQQMVERYGFVPRAPLGIELYATREEFAVRTTGLPQVGIVGVCFGRKLATVSPSQATWNLGMTLWHELAHVFHIGLSESRVPRWLTEGLAEWETATLERGWSRELDAEVYRALQAGRLPRAAHFNRAFTQAESMEDVAVAYHASKKMIDFVVATQGQGALVRILRELGKKRLPEVVIPEVLGLSWTELDEQFQHWLRAEYVRYEKQLFVSFPTAPLSELQSAAEEKQADRAAKREYALALVREGKWGQAGAELEALFTEQYEPEIALLLSRAWMRQGDKRNAERLLRRLLAEGEKSYEIHMTLARLALTEEKWAEVLEQTRQAASLDPVQVDAWSLQASAAYELGEREAEELALASWVQLAEQDEEAHLRYVEVLLALEKEQQAAQAAQRAIWAGLGQFRVHRLAALAFQRAGQKEQAEHEWGTARLLAQTEREKKQLEEDRSSVR